MSTKILLVDDHGIIRQGLRSLLEKQPDLEVVGEAEDGRMAFDIARELRPHIVIMDITMPNLNGVDATRRITDRLSNVKVIALSIHSNRRFVVDMLRAGASGYILKECLFDELIQAIKVVSTNNIYLSPRITGVIVDDYIGQLSKEQDKEKPALTDTEHEVLQLLAEGKNMKQIALELHVSVKTVEMKRRHVMKKLDIHSVAELTKYAIREGLTALEQ